LLAPVETAAPGSCTGKAGTPIAQTAAVPFSVMVNAVDANWNLVTTSDTVSLTSSDSNAMLPSPASFASLSSLTLSATLESAGSRTVTASDTSDGTKTANTSTAISVNAAAFVKLQLLAT